MNTRERSDLAIAALLHGRQACDAMLRVGPGGVLAQIGNEAIPTGAEARANPFAASVYLRDICACPSMSMKWNEANRSMRDDEQVFCLLSPTTTMGSAQPSGDH